MSKPVHVLQSGAEVKEIVNIAAIAVVDALFPGYVRFTLYREKYSCR